ncbi:hypothetical protein [Listeria immobilis]|uniref:hypothetical protein n=2 Tax=Listeria immobilis TaxID=2713502 RepID=UPI0021AB8E58|nr:hypothetical protein [Listeria immobilis]
MIWMTYQDRGIKKWQGFFLSEHNEQMDQQQASSKLKWREAMSSECIESVLSAAITHQSSLVIQKRPKMRILFRCRMLSEK